LHNANGKNKVITKISLPRSIDQINYDLQLVPITVINANFVFEGINQKQGYGILIGA
jgi:hypothetical protein